MVIKSDRFRSATLQPIPIRITGSRCYSSGKNLSASNLFHRIEHAVPFVSAHDTISEEAPSQAWSGKRRMCSPGLACDPSSIRRRASTARLTSAVQGLQGSGSRPCPFVWRMIPIEPRLFLRPTVRCEAAHMALRVARGCVDLAATRPCVRVPGVRVARLAGFDPEG